MSRRTLIRPPRREEPDAGQRSRRRQKLQASLEQERVALAPLAESPEAGLQRLPEAPNPYRPVREATRPDGGVKA